MLLLNEIVEGRGLADPASLSQVIVKEREATPFENTDKILIYKSI